MSARRQPLLSMITTSGFVREGLFDDTYNYATKVIDGIIENESFLPLIYELDSEDEMWDEDNWVKANPALDILKNRDELRENVERTKHDPNFALTVKVKDFNLIGVEQKAWLTYNSLNNEEVVDISKFDNNVAIGGFDLSRTGDLTAFSTLFYDKEKNKFVFETMYWMPEEKYKEEINSKIPYKQWVDRGLIRLSKGSIIDYQMISDYVYNEMAIKRGITYLKINYDAYSATYLVKELESMGFSDKCLSRTQQGFKTLSIPMQELESKFKEHKIIYQNNPVTKWCLSNVELVQDRNGNFMPKKPDNNKEKKIDGAATMINCFVGLVDNYENFISNF
jgi:phage terminase large subunit-like protein